MALKEIQFGEWLLKNCIPETTEGKLGFGIYWAFVKDFQNSWDGKLENYYTTEEIYSFYKSEVSKKSKKHNNGIKIQMV